jgi:hypothetical protein
MTHRKIMSDYLDPKKIDEYNAAQVRAARNLLQGLMNDSSAYERLFAR